VLLLGGCRRKSDMFVIALGDNIRTIDPIGSPSVDAASERVRTLIFNSLVKRMRSLTTLVNSLPISLARLMVPSSHSRSMTASSFHDGKVLTSEDVKYTLDLLFSSSFAKSASFYEGTGNDKHSYIKSVVAPDPKTVVVTLNKPWVGCYRILSCSNYSEGQLRESENPSTRQWPIQVCSLRQCSAGS
jgi:hypothetical protein